MAYLSSNLKQLWDMVLGGELFSGSDGFRRLRVDAGESGLFEGKQFYMSHEFDLDHSGSNEDNLVIKVDIGTDITLTDSEISVYSGGVRYGIITNPATVGGTFSETIDVIPKNTSPSAPDYTSQMSFSYGGTFSGTIADDTRYLDTAMTAAANNQRASAIGTGQSKNRVFGPATVYLLISKRDADLVNDRSKGALHLEWDEE